MRPFEQAWGLIKGFRHKYGPVTHFHGVRNIKREIPSLDNYMEVGRDPNQHREVIDSIRSKGLIPSELHGAVFMAPLVEAHGYAGGGPLFGIRTEGLDLEEGHMVDAHQQPHTIVRDTIDPERLVLISPNTFHENVDYRAMKHPESEDYIEPRNLPDGGLIDSFGRPRLTLKAMRQTTLGEFHPDLPSPYGSVKWLHGTPESNIDSIRRLGVLPNDGSDWGYGAFVTDSPNGARSFARNHSTDVPAYIGVREGAGEPEPRVTSSFATQAFPEGIPPEFLTVMPKSPNTMTMYRADALGQEQFQLPAEDVRLRNYMDRLLGVNQYELQRIQDMGRTIDERGNEHVTR